MSSPAPSLPPGRACHREKCRFGCGLPGRPCASASVAWAPLGTAGLASGTLAARPGTREPLVPEATGLGPVLPCVQHLMLHASPQRHSTVTSAYGQMNRGRGPAELRVQLFRTTMSSSGDTWGLPPQPAPPAEGASICPALFTGFPARTRRSWGKRQAMAPARGDVGDLPEKARKPGSASLVSGSGESLLLPPPPRTAGSKEQGWGEGREGHSTAAVVTAEPPPPASVWGAFISFLPPRPLPPLPSLLFIVKTVKQPKGRWGDRKQRFPHLSRACSLPGRGGRGWDM